LATWALWEYARSSGRKYELARRHLSDLQALSLSLSSRESRDWEVDSQSFERIQNHADGCVVQLQAAFDSAACAMAHHFQLPSPDRASFARIVLSDGTTSEEASAKKLVEGTRQSSAFLDLLYYRNLAAHRGILASDRATASPYELSLVERVPVAVSLHLPSNLLDAPDGPSAAVLPIVHRLTDWAVTPLSDVWEMFSLWLGLRGLRVHDLF
jgi:hypothetical protein